MNLKIGDVVKAIDPLFIQDGCECNSCEFLRAGNSATIIGIYGGRRYLNLEMEGLGTTSGYYIEEFCLAKPQLAEWEV